MGKQFLALILSPLSTQFNRKIVEMEAKSIPVTHIYNRHRHP